MDREGFYFIDTTDYDKAATALVKEGTFGDSYERPPIYPLFLASVYSISNQNFLLARLIQCFLGSLICLLIFIIAHNVYGFQVAFIAGFLASIYPIFIFISGLLYPATLVTLWLLLTVLFLLRTLESGSVFSSSIAGLFMGLAILTKPIAIFLLILLALCLLIKNYATAKNKTLIIVLFISCSCMVVSIWITRNYIVHKEISFIESNSRYNAMLNDLDSVQDQKPTSVGTKIKRMVLDQGHQVLLHFLSELPKFWELYPQRMKTSDSSKRQDYKNLDNRFQSDSPYIGKFAKYVSVISFTPILLFGTFGFLISIRKGQKILLLVSPILSFWFAYSLYFAKTRYRIPIEPFMFIFAAYELTGIVRRFSRRFSSN